MDFSDLIFGDEKWEFQEDENRLSIIPQFHSITGENTGQIYNTIKNIVKIVNKSIEFNLKHIRFIDSTGIGTLMLLNREIQSGKSGLQITNVLPMVYEVFELLGVVKNLNIQPAP